MFNLQLRQAETALREGRLNEAFQLATRPDVREHRDGQRLITRLTDEFLTRSKNHLEAGRLGEARSDCDYARRLAGNQEAIGELNSLITDAEQIRNRGTREKEHLISAARAELAQGECSLGGRLVAKLSEDDSSAGVLADTIDIRRDQIERAAERARAAVASGQLGDAADAVSELRRFSSRHTELPGLVDQLTKAAETEVRAELIAGRLDRAEWLLGRLGEFLDTSAELATFAPIPTQAKQIAKLLESANYTDASIELRRLSGVLPEAKWLSDVLAKTEQAARLHQELLSTPFVVPPSGGFTRRVPQIAHPQQRRQSRVAAMQIPEPLDTGSPAEAGTTNTMTDQAWLLQVDGAGSTLLVTSPRVMLGSRRVDIPLRGFSGTAPATIERTGGDYLIDSDADVEVGGRKAKRKLLSADESLGFGRRCRVRFRLPNPASTSAVLELNGPQLQRQDVRRIVLLDDALIAGPARTSHVVASTVETPCVLLHQDGEFFLRRGIASQRGKREAAQPIRPGESVELAGARFTLTPITKI